MTDLEGVAGVAEGRQVASGDDSRYREACRWLTQEVNAAIAGACAAGAREIIVNDGHGGGFNLVLEELDPRARCIIGGPRPEWLPLLDHSVDAVFAIGHHARAGTSAAVRDHTQSSAAWARFTLNGREMGELGQIAALAGAVGVPLTLVTGDDKTCREARQLLGQVETVEVKRGLGRECALTATPARAREMIRAGAERALRGLARSRPYRLRPPFRATVEFTSTLLADARPDVPGRRRTGPRSVEYRARTIKGLFALIFQ